MQRGTSSQNVQVRNALLHVQLNFSSPRFEICNKITTNLTDLSTILLKMSDAILSHASAHFNLVQTIVYNRIKPYMTKPMLITNEKRNFQMKQSNKKFDGILICTCNA